MKVCRECGAPIEWGAICDTCCDRERSIRLATPDTTRCTYCDARKEAPGHSEFVCQKDYERRYGPR